MPSPLLSHSPFRPKAPYDTQWAAEDAAERFEQMADAVRPHIARPLFQRFMAPTATIAALIWVLVETAQEFAILTRLRFFPPKLWS